MQAVARGDGVIDQRRDARSSGLPLSGDHVGREVLQAPWPCPLLEDTANAQGEVMFAHEPRIGHCECMMAAKWLATPTSISPS